MRIVGVIDLMGRTAVRAVGGRRHDYRPVVSRLCSSPDPVEVARGYRRLGLAELYVADLDAVALGVRRLLVLDLARVGMGRGTGTESLCAELAAAHPEVQVACGGGVRCRDDLVRLRDGGVRSVLLASALHDGLLSMHDLDG